MPLYDYECDQCDHRIELIRHLDDRNKPVDCPDCKTLKSMKHDDSGRDSKCSIPPVEF